MCGIAFAGESTGDATKNSCSNNGTMGIKVEDHSNPDLESNTCEGNTGKYPYRHLLYWQQFWHMYDQHLRAERAIRNPHRRQLRSGRAP